MKILMGYPPARVYISHLPRKWHTSYLCLVSPVGESQPIVNPKQPILSWSEIMVCIMFSKEIGSLRSSQIACSTVKLEGWHAYHAFIVLQCIQFMQCTGAYIHLCMYALQHLLIYFGTYVRMYVSGFCGLSEPSKHNMTFRGRQFVRQGSWTRDICGV